MILRKIFSFVGILSVTSLLLIVKMVDDGAPLATMAYAFTCLAVFVISSKLAGWWQK